MKKKKKSDIIGLLVLRIGRRDYFKVHVRLNFLKLLHVPRN